MSSQPSQPPTPKPPKSSEGSYGTKPRQSISMRDPLMPPIQVEGDDEQSDDSFSEEDEDSSESEDPEGGDGTKGNAPRLTHLLLPQGDPGRGEDAHEEQESDPSYDSSEHSGYDDDDEEEKLRVFKKRKPNDDASKEGPVAADINGK